MCYEEYIAYQCGHRSLSVLRPCPSTTHQFNLPVCTNHPVQQYNAATMCAVCERLLHSRWVLIMEWEHRWYHERGACGCSVVFPNLITRPRVIGSGPTAADAQTGDAAAGSVVPFVPAAPPAATSTPALPANPLLLAAPGPQAVSAPAGNVGISASGSTAVTGRGTVITSRASAGMRNNTSGRANRRGRGRGSINSTTTGSLALVPIAPSGAIITPRAPGHTNTSPAVPTAPPTAGHATASVPPIYSESVVDGERRVAIRLPGLFAAEWTEDHRALHRTNPSHCRVNTNPVRPISDETQMSLEERSLLAQCRAVDGMNPVLQGDQISAAVTRLGDIFSGPVPTETALIAGSGPYQPQHHNHAGTSAITQTLPSEVAVIAGGANPLPVLGLPAGAGPESITFTGSHMPPWHDCRLRHGPRKRRNSV